MNAFQLGFKNFCSKPLTSTLSILLLAISVGLISFVLMVADQVKAGFEKDLRGIDMVVGAKGSPLQLVLSAIYHMDVPTGNIDLAEAEDIRKNRFVGWSIPISYGDSYQGYRIVGTDTSYLGLYEVEYADGEPWSTPMEVVLGDRVAAELNLKLGDHFHGEHGLEEGGEEHHESHYDVVGILKKSNTVVDHLILTAKERVWEVHGHEGEQDTSEVTALLIKFKSPMGLINMPRYINQNTNLQAALPAFEINRLMSLMGIGIETLTWMGRVIMIVSAFSLFISLYTGLLSRKYDLALIRSFGGSRGFLAAIILSETFLLVSLGTVFGLVISRLGAFFLSGFAMEQLSIQFSWILLDEEYGLVFVVFILGFLSCLLPLVHAIRLNISETLAKGR